MRNIYLSEVILSDFRTYGPDTRLPLLPKPGVTILCGMNGLGKTALFEGVEWALTGDISRLRARLHSRMKLNDVLTRWSAERGTHEITLRFTNNETIKRGPLFTTPEAEIIRLMKAPDWKPVIQHVAPYLKLTHLLSQSSSQRFVDAGPNNQWALLRGAAGVDRLERLKTLLTSLRTRKAFQRKIKDLERIKTEREKRLNNFRDFQKRKCELQALAAAGSAISPENAIVQIQKISQKLKTADSPAGSVGAAGSAVGCIETLIGRINDAMRRDEVELERLSRVKTTVEQWEKINAARVVVETNFNGARNDVQKHSAAKESTHALLNRAQEDLGKIEKRRTELANRADLLGKLAEAQIERDDLKRQRAESEARLTKEKEALKAGEAQLAEIVKKQQQRQRLLDEQGELQKAERDFQEEEKLLEELAKARREAAGARAQHVEIAGIVKGLQEQKEVKSSEVQKQEILVRTLQSTLNAEKTAAGVMASAVAEIAARIEEDEVICPVCAHSHAPGILQKEAHHAAERLNARTQKSAEKVVRAEQDLATRKAELNAITTEERKMVEKLAVIERVLQVPQELVEAMDAHPVFSRLAPKEREEYPIKRSEEIKAHKATLSQKLAAESDPKETEITRQRLSRLVVERKESEKGILSERAAISSKLEARQATLAAHETEVLAFKSSAEGMKTERAAVLRSIETLALDIQTAKTRLAECLSAANQVTADLGAAQAKLAGVEQEFKDIDRRAKDLLSGWTEFGFEGKPDPSAPRKRTEFLSDQHSIHTRMRERLQTILRGLELWDRNEEIQRIDTAVAEILSEVDLRKGVPNEMVLAEAVQKISADLEHTNGAFDRATTIADELSDQAKDFSRAALEPLNSRIEEFNAIISPFKYSYRVASRSRPTTTDAKQVLHVQAFGEEVECDPPCHLSEGQSAALGLGVLFGAAVEYRWSRWPAMLLDDPLQSTDLIHASAFIDVIRGFVRDLGYQVILSTHDMEEAQFISRKCTRAGIPVMQNELIGIGPIGARFRTSSTE